MMVLFIKVPWGSVRNVCESSIESESNLDLNAYLEAFVSSTESDGSLRHLIRPKAAMAKLCSILRPLYNNTRNTKYCNTKYCRLIIYSYAAVIKILVEYLSQPNTVNTSTFLLYFCTGCQIYLDSDLYDVGLRTA